MSMITQVQSSQTKQKFNEIVNLQKIKAQIFAKMEHIDVLNGVYKQKSQVVFLRTFSKIMDQLSEQLKNAIEAYQNIDEEIQNDPKCKLLRKQVEFYKQQKSLMSQTQANQLKKLQQLKKKNKNLKQRRNQLRQKSINSHQKYIDFHKKNQMIDIKLNKFNLFSLQQTSDKKMTQSTKMPTSANNTRIKMGQSTKISTSANKTGIVEFAEDIQNSFSKKYRQKNTLNGNPSTRNAFFKSNSIQNDFPKQSKGTKILDRQKSFSRTKIRRNHTSEKKVKITNQSYDFF